MILPGFPTIVTLSGTSCITTVPAPIVAHLPILIPGIITADAPNVRGFCNLNYFNLCSYALIITLPSKGSIALSLTFPFISNEIPTSTNS